MDDGSTDGTRKLVEAFQPPVRYLHQANAGVSAARNVGAHVASSNWLAFLDSDDVWLPDYLERISRAIEATNGAAFTYFADPAEEGVGRTVWDKAGSLLAVNMNSGKIRRAPETISYCQDTILLYSDLLRRHPRPARHHRRELRRRLASAHWLRAKVKREERGPGASIAPVVRSLITSPGFFAGKLLRAAASTSPQTNTSASSGIDAMPSGTNPKNRNVHTHTARPTRFSAPR